MANTGDAPALPGSGYQLMPVPPGRVAAVVTYLEMRRPPADLHPLRPPPAGWSIRRVTDPGLDWYRGLFRRIGGDLLWYSRLVMADDALAAILRDPAIEIHVLLVDGREEGLLELDRRQPPDVELAFFGLAPTMVGRGAGGFLMRHALAKAWGAGCCWHNSRCRSISAAPAC